jgi:hypothetical protein
MAFHSLEVMEGMLESARDGSFHRPESRFDRPAPLPIDFPDSESGWEGLRASQPYPEA